MMASAGKRILMLLENCPFPQDGRVRREALALTEAGYEVAVISQRGEGQGGYENYRGIHVYRYPAPPTGRGLWGYVSEYGYSMLAALVLSFYVLLRHGFDVIHSHNPPDFFVAIAMLYKPFGKKYVYDHHDLAPDMYVALYGDQGRPLLHRLLLFFERLSLRQATHVIATNQSYKRVDMERGGVPAERITVVRNGPDPARVRPVAPDPELRSRGRTIIGYVGDMGYHDGVDYLLRALHHLVYDLGRTDCYCVIIGVGNAWADLKIQAQTLKLTPYVWFTGWVGEAELLRYLSTADICVDPDPKNPFTDRSSMIKLTEYMALGKPIVAFDLTEHRYTAQEACLYATPNDELDFARKLAELSDDPVRRQQMGAFGRWRIECELAWCHSIPPLLRAYDRVFCR
jgi:glycosyltransferase involved in cell wall biosynthesis